MCTNVNVENDDSVSQLPYFAIMRHSDESLAYQQIIRALFSYLVYCIHLLHEHDN